MKRFFSSRQRWWLSALQIVLLLAALTAPVSAQSTPAPPSGTALLELLQTYGIVRGDEQGNLNLDKPIKRAEMITIMVRALGKEEDAKLFIGLGNFPDAKGHWAEANITYAALKGLVKGDGNNAVRPEDPITYSEALTLILRVVGHEPTSGEWPLNVLFGAIDLKIVPEGVTAANVNSPAIRGEVFKSLAIAISTVRTADGRTFLQAYVDSTPPELAVESAVENAATGRIQVKGTVKGASSVTVNGKAAVLNGLAFSADVELEPGQNQIQVIAYDLAGNQQSAAMTVNRTAQIASLEVTGPAKVRPGSTVTYQITAKDAGGKSTSLTGVTASVEGAIGTFELVSGKLTAANTPASGKIVLKAGSVTKSFSVDVMGQSASVMQLGIRPVNDGVAVSYTKPMTVQVETLDADGKLVDSDFGRPISLAVSGLAGAQVTPSIAYTEAGVATFTVTAPKIGDVTLTASSTEVLPSTSVGSFGSTTRVVLKADTDKLVVGADVNMTRIRAELRDENGQLAKATSTITIRLSVSGTDGYLSDEYLTIRPGLSTSNASGDDGFFNIRIEAGTAVISGVATADQKVTVDPVRVTVSIPTTGVGTRLVAVAPERSLGKNETGNVWVRVVDAAGNVVPTGSYAFQLKVDTSNGEGKTQGIPDGVTVQVGTTGLNPVSDGKAEGSSGDGDDIIARTQGGQALIQISYNKPGRVTITPIPMSATTKAYNTAGDEESASSSTGFKAEAGTATYQAGVTGVQLTADSVLGSNGDAAAMTNSTASSATLRATLTDGANWVPGTSFTVQLMRVDPGSTPSNGCYGAAGTGVTTLPATTSLATVDGKATFVVRGTRTVGQDTYQMKVTVGNMTACSNLLAVYLEDTMPETPVIAAIRGMRNGNPGALNYVNANDDGMSVELQPISGSDWVQVKVYRENNSSPIYTSGPIDATVAPRVTVPKSVLSDGVSGYSVIIRNGFKESSRSTLSDPVTNATVTTNVSINGAKYDVAGNLFYINGSGFSSGDSIDLSLLEVNDASTSERTSLSGATVKSVSSNQITLNVQTMTNLGTLSDPASFAGSDVTLDASSGWYTRSNGSVAGDDTGNAVTPGARIDHVEYNKALGRVSIYGEGFGTGSVDFSKINLTVAGGTSYVANRYNATRISDKLLTFTIPSTDAARTALDSNGSYVLNANAGWFRDGSAYRLADTGLQIYAQVTLSQVSYAGGKVTIKGTGLGGSVDPDMLYIINLSNNARLQLTSAATSVTDTEIVLTLADPTAFENANFKGRYIYLRGDATWLHTSQGRDAAAIPDNALLFPTRP